MHCKNCGKEMEDTHSTSYGTGTSIYKCKNCGWSGSPPFLDKNPKDVYHHGIKYKDYIGTYFSVWNMKMKKLYSINLNFG